MIKQILISVMALSVTTIASADAANKPVLKKIVPPPPDYFPLRIKDSEGKPIEWWWKYTYVKCNLNGKPIDKKPEDFKIQVINAVKQPDETILWQLDTTSPAMKTIREWYMKAKEKVVWHKEQYGDDETMRVQFSPERVLLTNPPTKDETWPWKGKGNMGIEINNMSTVSGPEEVITPAGKFQAMKVTVTGTQGGQPINMSYWYANYIGLVKSTATSATMDSESQLLDYSFKNPPPK